MDAQHTVVEPVTQDRAEALVEGNDAFTRRFGYAVADGYLEFPEALPAILPLVRGTLDNLEHLGISAALTGPIARGDVDTVRRHLARLSPRERTLYSALGLEALELAKAAGLDARRAAELEALLSFE